MIKKIEKEFGTLKHCPKCGNDFFKRIYMEPYTLGAFPGKGILILEYMLVECTLCGYQDKEKCKDADTTNLCDSCSYHFATCKKNKCEFGNGVGNDNVILCDGYKNKDLQC